jgi:hypothetical protein
VRAGVLSRGMGIQGGGVQKLFRTSSRVWAPCKVVSSFLEILAIHHSFLEPSEAV